MSLLLCVALACPVLAGCAPDANEPEDTYDRDFGLNPTAENAFFDDFTDREYSEKLWHLGNSKWGPEFNHGVKPENVSWNQESGIVTIKSFGKYYPNQSKNYQGGTIATKAAYGPGRIETRMKMVPRFGPCTALWTFMYGDSEDLNGNYQVGLNQEIDIEMNVGNDFRNVWFTNWHTEEASTSIKGKTEFFNADGEWHKYTIEWHTDPMRIDYYVDDVCYTTIKSHVPYVAGTIIVGNWFPDGWAGVADFEEDYMQVDYISYTPYKSQPFVDYEGDGEPKTEAERFPKESTPLPEVANMMVNSGFEYTYKNGSKVDYIWSLADGDVEAVIEDGIGREGGKAMKLDKDAMTIELVPDLLEGFKYRVKAWVKLSDANAMGEIGAYFLKSNTESVGQPVKKTFSAADAGYVEGEFFQIEMEFTVPEGASRVDLAFGCSEGTVILDDVFMNMSKKLDKAA